MSEEITVKKVSENTPEGKRSFGKPRDRWLDDVENYVKKKLALRGWRKTAKDRDAWKLILKDKIHFELVEWSVLCILLGPEPDNLNKC
jgi:hypothetical protein